MTTRRPTTLLQRTLDRLHFLQHRRVNLRHSTRMGPKVRRLRPSHQYYRIFRQVLLRHHRRILLHGCPHDLLTVSTLLSVQIPRRLHEGGQTRDLILLRCVQCPLSRAPHALLRCHQLCMKQMKRTLLLFLRGKLADYLLPFALEPQKV